MFEGKKEVEVDADEEFNEMYNSLRKKYEKPEKKIRNLSSLIGKAEIVLLAVLILGVFISILNPIFLLLITLDLIIAVVLVILKDKLLKNEKKKLKTEMIANFVKDINEGFMFDEEGELSERSYKLSGFDRTFNIFETTNYLEGYLDDDTKIILADINVKYEKKIDNKKIVDKKFKDVFDVFADEAMFHEVFDKQLIRTIMGYIKKFNIKLELIIEGSNVYFRFHNKDLINYKNFGSNEEKLCLWKYYCMIQLIYIIVDRINNL